MYQLLEAITKTKLFKIIGISLLIYIHPFFRYYTEKK